MVSAVCEIIILSDCFSNLRMINNLIVTTWNENRQKCMEPGSMASTDDICGKWKYLWYDSGKRLLDYILVLFCYGHIGHVCANYKI